jgi:hypothetical protein
MSLNAKVGDIIQYRFRTGGGFTSYDAKPVELVEENGFWVKGGYFVAKKDLITVIPMHEETEVDREISEVGFQVAVDPLHPGQ